jgi:hypothetical protein
MPEVLTDPTRALPRFVIPVARLIRRFLEPGYNRKLATVILK